MVVPEQLQVSWLLRTRQVWTLVLQRMLELVLTGLAPSLNLVTQRPTSNPGRDIVAGGIECLVL